MTLQEIRDAVASIRRKIENTADPVIRLPDPDNAWKQCDRLVVQLGVMILNGDEIATREK